jgi:hypothetical protein
MGREPQPANPRMNVDNVLGALGVPLTINLGRYQGLQNNPQHRMTEHVA